MREKTIIQKAFDTIFSERVHEVAWRKTKADPLFYDAEIKTAAALNRLIESLNEEQRQLLNDYINANDSESNFFLENTYIQGLQDSPMLHKELSEYGISIKKETH